LVIYLIYFRGIISFPFVLFIYVNAEAITHFFVIARAHCARGDP